MKNSFTPSGDVKLCIRFPWVHLASLLFFLVISCSLSAQQKITGKVFSADTTLQGVTVSVKGTTKSTQTDEKRQFTINASPKSTLVFSSVGFLPQELGLNNKSSLTIRLQSSV